MKKIVKLIIRIISNKDRPQVKLTDQETIEEGLNPNFHGNNKVRDITLGKYSYVSFNSIIYYTDIGKYCSIGPNVVTGYGDHPITNISTSPYVYLNQVIYNQVEINNILISHFKRVKIENDVWIGANVFIKNGIRIGNGAVVGAGAVVIKDVKDYEIVAGVPAEHIRFRFNDEIIKELLASEWWNFDPDKLAAYKTTLLNPDKQSLKQMIKELYNGK
jgi:acetyltransferase-like isoleucine patch superfamily enzyme